MSIQLSNIAKHYGVHRVLEEVTLQLVPSSRIGLIGRNGAGKSTLLKIIMGLEEPDTGTVSRSPGMTVNFLSQEPTVTASNTLYEEIRTVFARVDELNKREEDILAALSDETLSGDEQMKLAHHLHTVHCELERLDVQNMDARIGRVLKGLGFSQAEFEKKVGEFSGGWRMRVNLAKILLEGADFLLLDEPTNHLDLDACEWLENYLSGYPGGLMIVSHDRRFLDRTTTEIAEVQHGTLRVWSGNYSDYLRQKAEEAEDLQSAYQRQQKELEKQSAFIERFRASATKSTQAKSREKLLAKVERIELPEEERKQRAFRFPAPRPSGHEVITIRNLEKSFGDKHLFSKLNAGLERDQRVFLLGANGSGKTTLFRLILSLEKADAGEIKLGHNANLAYFSQHQLETLDPKASLFDTLQQIRPDLNNTQIRGILGRFLFSGDTVFKTISTLSGGEKSKVALAKMMISGPNTLLLDEPTNHIDIQTKDVMTQALKDFEGSLLCISHDRYFIQELATDIWELYNGHLITYCGNYEYYLSKREELRAQVDRQAKLKSNQSEVDSKPVVSPHQQSFREKKEQEKQFKKLEKQIIQHEKEIAALEQELHHPDNQQDNQKLQEISAQLSEQHQSLEALNQEWTLLAEVLNI